MGFAKQQTIIANFCGGPGPSLRKNACENSTQLEPRMDIAKKSLGDVMKDRVIYLISRIKYYVKLYIHKKAVVVQKYPEDRIDFAASDYFRL